MLKAFLKFILVFFYVLSFVLFTYFIFKLNIIPSKYLLIGYGIYALVSFIIIILILNKYNLLSYLILVIITFVMGYSSTYLKNTYSFLDSIDASKQEDIINYELVVLNDSNYNKLEDLNNTKIAYLEDNKININNYLLNNIEYTEVTYDDFSLLQENLFNKNVSAICLEESYLNLLYDEFNDFKDNTKIIYEFKTNYSEDSVVFKEEEVFKEELDSFIVYISGIDQYGDITSVRGRSDVNIIAVINPSSNKVLLINTPRDYYVQLAGTTGLKDKLTHAGIYGINKSIQTLENLYDINIDNYIRINFDSLIKVVDVIGGIDIYSDKEFTPSTNNSFVVKEGLNHFNGEQALAYARERYAYQTGDNHRGQNQQQIITAIIEKVSKSSVLISKYNSILKSLDKSFQTDITMNDIINLIKNEFTQMKSWEVESIQVTGFDSKNYTYSMGKSRLLYVMEPNYDSINIAKEKIGSVLNGVSES